MHAREIINDYELEIEEYIDGIADDPFDDHLDDDLDEWDDWHDEWDEFDVDPHVEPGDLRPLEELDRIVLPGERADHPRHLAGAA